MAAGTTGKWNGLRAIIGSWEFDNPLRKKRHAGFLDTIEEGLEGDEVILDLGAGSGFLSIDVAKRLRHGKVLALDVSKDMLGHLERNAEKKGVRTLIETLHTDTSKTGLENGSVDIVMTSFLIHELRDPGEALREAYRVLKPGGKIFIIDFKKTFINGFLKFLHDGGAHGPFDEESIERLLLETGFQDVKVAPEGKWLAARAGKGVAACRRNDPPDTN
jgi:ubiquinone/menaquinone biosynthesis C-methylase UbiE